MKAQRQRLEALCVGTFLISIAACLPEVQILPSVERPFVFMHLASCSLILGGLADSLGLPSHVLYREWTSICSSAALQAKAGGQSLRRYVIEGKSIKEP